MDLRRHEESVSEMPSEFRVGIAFHKRRDCGSGHILKFRMKVFEQVLPYYGQGQIFPPTPGQARIEAGVGRDGGTD